MKNFKIKYGVIGAAISIGLGLINWFTIAQWYGPKTSQIWGYMSIVVSLMCVPLGIKYFRDKLNGGIVSFAKGFKVGLGITLTTSIIIFFYGVTFFGLAADSFREWSKRGLSATELAELEAQIAQTPDFVFSAWFQSLMLALTVLLIGLIINLISSLVLKRTEAIATS